MCDTIYSNIRTKNDTKELLNEIGKKPESYDTIIKRLITFYNKYQKTNLVIKNEL